MLLSKTVDVFCFGGGGLYKLEAQEAFAFLDIFFNITEILQQHLCRVLLKLITFKQGKKKHTHTMSTSVNIVFSQSIKYLMDHQMF